MRMGSLSSVESRLATVRGRPGDNEDLGPIASFPATTNLGALSCVSVIFLVTILSPKGWPLGDLLV